VVLAGSALSEESDVPTVQAEEDRREQLDEEDDRTVAVTLTGAHEKQDDARNGRSLTKMSSDGTTDGTMTDKKEPDGKERAVIKLNASGRERTNFRTKNGFGHQRLLGVSIAIGDKTTTALLDSGCDAELIISEDYADENKIDSKPMGTRVELPDGTSIAAKETEELQLTLHGLRFCAKAVVIDMKTYDCILGRPWLSRFNPHINWRKDRLLIAYDGQRHEMDANVDPSRQGRKAAELMSQRQLNRSIRAKDKIYALSVNSGLRAEPTELDSALEPQWKEMLGKYSNVFPAEHPGYPPERSVELEIDIEPGIKPISKPVYRLSPAELDELKDQLTLLLEKGLIRPSTSPWGAPVLFTKKKDGGLRMCLDYRMLNDITVKNKCPIPRIDEMFDRLSSAERFTTLDLRSGYYQIRVRDEDVPKTGIRTRYGSFEFTVMPFGLTNAPSTFQALMNEIFRDFIDDFVLVYLDDILIYGKEKDHLRHVEQVLRRLSDHKLFAKASKCEFNKTSVDFLGHVVQRGCVKMQDKKVSAIVDWPTPRTVTEIQAFMGLANYYRMFVRDFSSIAAPITHSTRGKVKQYVWEKKQQDAFAALKSAFTTAPVLRLVDPNRAFTLTTDASDVGLGAVLQQEYQDGLHPVAFLSRKLLPAEVNYATHDKELLAIVYALKTWRPYLHGAKFRIQTDHHPLIYLQTQPELSRRQRRWIEVLNEFDFNVEYLKGKWNLVADALSRRADLYQPDLYTGEDEDELSVPVMALNAMSASTVALDKTCVQELLSDYAQDAELAEIWSTPTAPYSKTEQGLLYKDNGTKLCVPQGKLRLVILHDAHDSISAGHLGIDKTVEHMQRRFYWPRMRQDVQEYVRSCGSCQRNKKSTQKPIGKLCPTEVPERRWEHVTMDFVSALPRTREGFDAIFVVVDKLTKQVVFVPTATDATAADTARLYLKNVYRHHGLPRKIISDRDTRFTSKFWKELHRLLQVKLAMSSAFHPQTDGQTERMNRSMEEMLRHYVSYDQKNWADLLPLLEFTYNNSVHKVTRQTPFMLNTGQHPLEISDLLLPPNRGTKVANVTTFVSQLRDMTAAAREAILLANDSYMKYADKDRRDVVFDEGDKVLLSTKFFRPPADQERRRKLSSPYAGPFEIVKRISPVAYRLKLPVGTNVHDVFHASLLKEYHADKTGARIEPIPEAVLVDGETEYVVDTILDHRMKRNRMQYLVSWKGYSHDDSTWEPLKNVQGSEALLMYQAAHPDART
jgi:hypothetical protein